MKIDKAIRTLENYHKIHSNEFYGELSDALKLGVEALRAIKDSRFDPSTWTPHLLPGETKS